MKSHSHHIALRSFAVALLAIAAVRASAQTFDPKPWPATWNAYTVKATPINDRKTTDQSNGGTSPQNIANISSGTPDESLPSVYFAHSATSNTLFIRFRLASDPNAYNFGNVAGADPWSSAQWSMFIDVDGDGWRDFVIFLDGASGSPSTPIDRIRLIYSRLKTSQSIDFTQPGIYLLGEIAGAKAEPNNRLRRYDGSGVTYTTDWSDPRTTLDFGTSRITDLTASGGDYLLDFQVPISMLDARPYNGPQLSLSTIQSISFATANSLNDPFQKDFAYPGAFCASSTSPMPGGDPITFDNSTVPSVVVTSVTATFCPNFTLTTRILTAQQVPDCNTVISSAVDVKFYYYWDQNANGIPDDGGSDWVLIGSGAATTLGEWSTSWNSSSLPQGQYLIKVRGTDTQNFTQDSYSQSTTQYGSTIAVVQNNCGIIPATMAKSVTPTLVQSNAPDRTVTYTITISNPQASAITLSQVQDTLPSGFTYTGTVTGSGLLSPTTTPTNPSTGTITWAFSPAVSIPAGQSATLRFTATTSMTAGTYRNTATAAGSTFYAPVSNAAPVTVTNAAATLVKSASTNVGLNPGNSLTYTLTYTNTGSEALSSISIVDSLVQGLTFVSADNGGAYDALSGKVTWTVGGPVTAGQGGSVSVTVSVNSPYNGTNPLTNSARLTAPQLTGAVFSNTTNNTVLGPVLSLSKSASPVNAYPGNTVTFTILYGNSGTGDATGVIVRDTLPANCTYVNGSASPLTPTVTTVSGRQVLSFSVGGIAAGGGNLNNSIEFQAIIANPYPTVGESQRVDNIATIVSNETATLTGATPVFVTAIPVVSIVKTSARAAVLSQDTVTFTLTLTNNGFFAATLDSLVDVLPNTFSYLATTGGNLTPTTSPAANATGSIKWSFSPSVSLTPGSTSTLSFQSRVAIAGGSYTNTGRARGIVNSATDGVVSTTLPITVAEGEEVINKSVNEATGFVGDTLIYTINYLNGTGSNQSRTITDTLDATLTYVSQTISAGGTFNGINGRVLTWATGTVAAGGSRTITVRAVASTGSVTVTNRASANTTPVSPSNTVATVIQSPPNITFTKTVDVATAPTGTELTYTISYLNASGVAPSTNTIISDTLSSSLTYVTSSVTGGGVWYPTPAQKGRLQWNIGTIAANTGGSVTFKATIDDTVAVGREIRNWARLTNDEGQNRSSSAVTTVSAIPNFTLSKSVNKVSAGPSDTLTYTISYENTGSATATSVVLRDTIPANTSFVSASNGGAEAAGIVTWNVGSVAAGVNGSVTFLVRIASPLASGSVAQIANRASVTSDNAAPRTSATVLTNVLYPQIAAVKTVDSASARSLSRITYTITLSNSTIIPGTNTVVTDAIPANTQYVASSTTVNGVGVADVASTSPLVSGLNVGTVTTGSPVVVTFQATIVAPIADGTVISNRATFATAKLTGTDSSNIVTTTAISFPNMTLSKNVNRSAAQPGDTVTYTVTYSNTGTATAGFVIITDGIPANTTYVANSVVLNGTPRTDAADADGVAVSGGMVTATIGTVASGGSGTMTFRVRVN